MFEVIAAISVIALIPLSAVVAYLYLVYHEQW
jgi:hypothetical protein